MSSVSGIENRKLYGLLILLCVPLLLAACGGEEERTTSDERLKPRAAKAPKPKPRPSCGPPTKAMSSNEIGEPGPEEAAEPEIRPPCGPAPQTLVVRDLKKGSGRAAKPGDKLRMRFFGADYVTGKPYYGTWYSTGVVIELGAKTREEVVEIGLRGMSAGGRRELLVPARLTAIGGPMIYLIDLFEVRPG